MSSAGECSTRRAGREVKALGTFLATATATDVASQSADFKNAPCQLSERDIIGGNGFPPPLRALSASCPCSLKLQQRWEVA